MSQQPSAVGAKNNREFVRRKTNTFTNAQIHTAANISLDNDRKHEEFSLP